MGVDGARLYYYKGRGEQGDTGELSTVHFFPSRVASEKWTVSTFLTFEIESQIFETQKQMGNTHCMIAQPEKEKSGQLCSKV